MNFNQLLNFVIRILFVLYANFQFPSICINYLCPCLACFTPKSEENNHAYSEEEKLQNYSLKEKHADINFGL